MAATVYLDKIDGSAASGAVMAGATVTRIATVDGLPAGITVDAGALFDAAAVAVLGVTGPLGSPCPNISAPTYLDNYTLDSISVGVVKIRLNYKGFPVVSVELATCLETVDTNLDNEGTVLSVEYTYPSDYFPDPRNVRGKTITQGGVAPKRISETAFILKYTVTAAGDTSASDIVLTFSQAYCGSVNISVWSSAPGGARTWICESARGISRDGGHTYELTVTFRYRSDTWDTLLVFINPDTGKPPHDLEAGTGYKKVRIQDEGVLPIMPP